MKGQQFKVNSRKYDFSLRRSWSATLVELTDDYILLEGFFEHPVEHSDLGTIAKGTRSVEVFLFDRWYNYFIFYGPDGVLRNYYINISMPPQVSEKAVDYIDLDIDIILWPDGRIEVLDEAEFEENTRVYGYPSELIEKALKLKDQISDAPLKYLTSIRS